MGAQVIQLIPQPLPSGCNGNNLLAKSLPITFDKSANITPTLKNPPIAVARTKKSDLNPNTLPAVTPTRPMPAAMPINVNINVLLPQRVGLTTNSHI